MTEESSFPSIYRRSGGALLIVLLMFNLLTLGRIPEVPHGDDGGYAAAAYQFWQTGHPGVPGYRDLLGLDKDILIFGRTAAAVQGIFMYLFGVSLFTALLPSVLAGFGSFGPLMVSAGFFGVKNALYSRSFCLRLPGCSS